MLSTNPGPAASAWLPVRLGEFVDGFPAGPIGVAVVAGAALVLVLFVLYLLVTTLRTRPGSTATHRSTLLGSPGRPEQRSWLAAPDPRLDERPLARPATLTLTGRAERAAPPAPGAAAYRQALQALRQQAPAAEGLELAEQLADLADALERHTVDDAQDLTPFALQAQQLLRFTVRVQPRTNTDLVALRFRDGLHVLVLAEGPFEPVAATRFVEATERLQGRLRAWLEPLRTLFPPRDDANADADAADEADAAVDTSAIPTFDAEPAEASLDADAIDASDASDPTDPVGLGERPNGAHPPSQQRDLPPALQAAIEGLQTLRDALEAAPRDGLHTLERYLMHDGDVAGSVLERLDRFVFTPFDATSLAASDRDDAHVARVLAWLAAEQARLTHRLGERFGLRPHAAAVGEPFDATLHVAIDTEVVTERSRDRTVARVHRRGYTLERGDERRVLLRPDVTVCVVDDDGAGGAIRLEPEPRSARRRRRHARGV